MSIPVPIKTAAFLAIALVTAACAVDSEPDAEVTRVTAASGRRSDSKTTPAEPATVTTIPTGTPADTPTPEPSPSPQRAVDLPDLGPAPDIANEVWLNTDRPLNLASLKGEVVLVEFWTFG